MLFRSLFATTIDRGVNALGREGSIRMQCPCLSVPAAACASNGRWRPTGATRGNCSVPHAVTARRCPRKRQTMTDPKALPDSVSTATKTDASNGNDAAAFPLQSWVSSPLPDVFSSLQPCQLHSPPRHPKPERTNKPVDLHFSFAVRV